MKIEKQINDDHQAELTVEVDSESFEGTKRRAARKLARRVKIPGFRPGKAPYPVIVKQIGEARILEEALDILVEEIYPQILEEAEINPYGPGSLENIQSTDPPVLDFLIPLVPEIDLGEYKTIRKPYNPTKIDSGDVEEVLENLQERQAIMEPVERPAEEGDLVTINLSGIRSNVEGNDKPKVIDNSTAPVLIRPEEKEKVEEENELPNREWPFAGFSRNLIGLSEKEIKEFEHTYPESEDAGEFSGAVISFQVEVENVKSRTLPDLDENFAEAVGGYPDVKALRGDIRANLEKQAEGIYNESYDNEILEEVIQMAQFIYPPQALERETDNAIHNLETQLERQNMNLELYMKTKEIDEEGLREEVYPLAESSLKKSLFLIEFAKLEDISVDESEILEETNKTVGILSQGLSKKEAKKLSNKNVYNNLYGNIMTDMISRRAMESFRDMCSGAKDEKEYIEENQIEDKETSNVDKHEIIEEVKDTSSNEKSAADAKDETENMEVS